MYSASGNIEESSKMKNKGFIFGVICALSMCIALTAPPVDATTTTTSTQETTTSTTELTTTTTSTTTGTTSTLAPVSSILGFNSKGVNTDYWSTYLWGSLFNATGSGRICNITAYLQQYGSNTPNVIYGLYLKNGSIIGQTTSWTVTSSWNGWKTLPMICVNVAANTEYYLLAYSTAYVRIYYSNGALSYERAAPGLGGNLPNTLTFPPTFSNGRNISIYASIIATTPTTTTTITSSTSTTAPTTSTTTSSTSTTPSSSTSTSLYTTSTTTTTTSTTTTICPTLSLANYVDDFICRTTIWNWDYKAGNTNMYAPESVSGYTTHAANLTLLSNVTSAAYADSALNERSTNHHVGTMCNISMRLNTNNISGTWGFGFWDGSLTAPHYAWFWAASNRSYANWTGFRAMITTGSLPIFNVYLNSYQNYSQIRNYTIERYNNSVIFYINNINVAQWNGTADNTTMHCEVWIDNGNIDSTGQYRNYSSVKGIAESLYADWMGSGPISLNAYLPTTTTTTTATTTSTTTTTSSTSSTFSPSGGVIGFDAKGVNTDYWSEYLWGSLFNATRSGRICNITAYLQQYSSSTPNVTYGLYVKNGSIVGQTASWTVSSTWNGWKTLPMTCVNVTMNTEYYLLAYSTAYVRLYYAQGGISYERSQPGLKGNLPNALMFPPTFSNRRNVSIYASIVPNSQ